MPQKRKRKPRPKEVLTMAKELVITTDDIKNNLSPSEKALDCYKFICENAGLLNSEEEIADFVAKRNAKSGWTDLWELKSWCEKIAESIKKNTMHAFNIGTAEELPNNVTWKSSGTTKSFKDGAGSLVIQNLISKKLVTKEQVFDLIDPSKVAKTAGIKVEKLMDMFPDVICEAQKAPSLTIK